MKKENIFIKNSGIKKFLILLLVLILLFSIISTQKKRKSRKFNLDKFDIEKISIGNIDKVVSATGMINAKDIVKVGSQVSGIIEKVYVDYNDIVKKGQKLAKIETDVLERALKSAESSLKQSESDFKLIKLNTERVRTLYKNNYIAQADLDKAENDLISAKEAYNRAKIKYETAKIQLSQAYIESPVNGTIISRDVNEGQTISTGYTTPVLFNIAEDMSKMQIETSISEADIGMINNDLKVSFTVDAYKDRIFSGLIKQIRLVPAVEQNVVVYTVIIEINNEERILLPGMTAYVFITIDSVKNALRVPNTVFRFKATKQIRKVMNIKEPNQEEKNYWSRMIKDKKHVILYVIRNGKPEAILVEKGLSDLTYTEIKTDQLKEGDIIISSYLQPKHKK